MAKSNTGFWRRTSIQARVRTALVGVLLLTAPQVALTLYYLADLSEAAHSVHQRVHLVMVLTKAELRADELAKQSEGILPPELEKGVLESMEAWEADIQTLATDHPEAMLSELVDAAEDVKTQWLKRTERLKSTAAPGSPPADGTAPPVVVAAPVLDWSGVKQAFQGAFVQARDQMKTNDTVVEKIFGKASRNLVSLTILAFIFVAALIVMLPARLVRPLRHITEVIRQAAEGKYGVTVQIDTQDEVGQLAQAFQKTMVRVRDFDERKKDRIVEDGAKIDALIRHMPMAAAILNRGYVIEVANDNFNHLFELTDQDVDQPWPDGFAEGSERIRQVLDSVVNHREALVKQVVTVHGGQGPLSLEMSVDYCRDRAGKVGFVLVLIHNRESTQVQESGISG